MAIQTDDLLAIQPSMAVPLNDEQYKARLEKKMKGLKDLISVIHHVLMTTFSGKV
jgi:hypothetical protein